MKTKGTAIVLAFLLGSIGGHKFYLGQTGQGLLYLFFSWTFIPALIAVVELLMLATMSDGEFNRRFNAAPLAMLPAPAPVQNQMGQNVTINMQSGNVADELHKLHELHKVGAINADEFQRQKARLLS